jgi:hypothetical protein
MATPRKSAPAVGHTRGATKVTGPRKIVPLVTEVRAGVAAAPLAAAPHLQYHGGPLLGSVEVIPVFWGAFWTQAAGGAPLVTSLNAFFDFILTSALMDTLQEYSTPGTVIGKGRRISTVIVSSSEPGTVTPTGRLVTDAEIQQAIQGWIANKTVPSPTANSLYFVYFPPNVTVSFQGSQSCQTFCGYHEHINNSIFYAVEPHITCAGCSFGSILDSLTKVSSHELAEAVTDPAGTGWWDPNTGDEIGDICNTSSTRLGGFLVQNEWSNARAACVLGAATAGAPAVK